jgi:alkylhydroperoxidase family enzyme
MVFQSEVNTWCLALLIVGVAGAIAWSAEVGDGLAKTRPEMKKRIEALKTREARIPLPALAAEEVAAGRRSVNNGRLRSIYLPESWQTSNFNARAATPGATPRQEDQQRMSQMQSAPDYPFKTRLFWIVSRTNDCQYCLGHQELKLRRVGMTDDQIAALDSRWTAFPPEEQAAITFARKLTLTPHLVTDADVQALKLHYRDPQVIDILQTMAGNNSTNRWTASTGIPQDRSFGGDEPSELDTPTSAEFSSVESRVAPFDYKPRPNWESRAEVEAAMTACLHRTARVKLPSIQVARQVLAADTPGTIPPVWFQAMSDTPPTALRVWKLRQAEAREGKLNSGLKAQIAWVCAREDRAWYAAAHARARLNALGVSDDVLFAIGGDDSSFTPADQATFAFARKLTSAPHAVGDQDVAALRALFSDHEVAEIIFLICDANSFDRFTETLNLPLEGGSASVSQAP